MPAKLRYGRERAAIGIAVLNCMRVMRNTHLPKVALGELGDLLFVGFHVFIGHAHGRPQTVAALSHSLELSRATVARRLKRLIELGVVESEGVLYYMTERINQMARDALQAHMRSLQAAIVDAEAALKMAEIVARSQQPNG